MNRPGHNTAQFFVGTEVEHTPAHGLRTLFVVGLQDVTTIGLQINQHQCEHVYFGANHSFPVMGVNDARWFEWENMILPFLHKKIWCTLEVDVAQILGLAEGSLIEQRTFIPMLSCKLPYLRLLNYNATLKIDDQDFDATNPGVWCHSLHDLQDRSKFTSWSDYTKDEVVK